LNDIIRRIKLAPVNHILGFVFGVAEALAVIVIILFLINIQPLFDKAIILDGSVFAGFLLPRTHSLFQALKT
jgi:uncharacterized membrane protein required for colicin V production